ncbi:hypothetical protein BamIOP4010DRAFT_4363 [Burkholderia ambifaria IOP40-10]|uniref:Uncharacterized protein n=1 Tax=Burkholderia ambifaria IOP40-10 TaxID=396596 RepID=B1FK02_9BURK|nr:hypothetical protein BamIOP4010DRAFT_4363 [Burkholderia ambifaria IOP40-10]
MGTPEAWWRALPDGPWRWCDLSEKRDVPFPRAAMRIYSAAVAVVYLHQLATSACRKVVAEAAQQRDPGDTAVYRIAGFPVTIHTSTDFVSCSRRMMRAAMSVACDVDAAACASGIDTTAVERRAAARGHVKLVAHYTYRTNLARQKSLRLIGLWSSRPDRSSCTASHVPSYRRSIELIDAFSIS